MVLSWAILFVLIFIFTFFGLFAGLLAIVVISLLAWLLNVYSFKTIVKEDILHKTKNKPKQKIQKIKNKKQKKQRDSVIDELESQFKK